MAAEDPVQELCQEASCSICLEFFRDPVTLTECGHNFCQACLTRRWEESGTEPSCPQCRGRAPKRKFWPNRQLANFVEIIKKLRPSEEKGGLCEKHQEPLKFFCKEDEVPICTVCGVSKEHKDHEVVPLEEAFQEDGCPSYHSLTYQAVMTAGKGRVCQKHQESLKLFCKDDESLICVVCDRSKEHKDHETLPLEEASEEYKDHFCNCVESLKKKKERIVAYKEDVEKESQDLLKQTEVEKQETLARFSQLHAFLEEQEKLLLAQVEEVEKEVARNRDQLLVRLSEELSSLESLIQEMEEKSQQSASDLLQDVQSTLKRYEEREAFGNPVTFPLALKWRIWNFCDINHSMEAITKQMKDTLDSGLDLQKDFRPTPCSIRDEEILVEEEDANLEAANVMLDPDTAYPKLIVSEDKKSVRLGERAQALPNSPERFDNFRAILGLEGFTAGCHFWEVCVGNEEEWMVGVARKSMRRKGDLPFSPEGGMWAVGKWKGLYRAAIKDLYPSLTVSGDLKKIRVCLNYAAGRVAFFRADQAALLYEFAGASFAGETLLPFFWVSKKGHLKIC